MQLVNRHYVMTKVLGRNRISDYLKLIFFEFFSIASGFRNRSTRALLWGSVVG